MKTNAMKVKNYILRLSQRLFISVFKIYAYYFALKNQDSSASNHTFYCFILVYTINTEIIYSHVK